MEMFKYDIGLSIHPLKLDICVYKITSCFVEYDDVYIRITTSTRLFLCR